MPDELWTEVCDIVQRTVIKTIPKKKKCKKAKWLSEEALQNSCEKKRSEKQKRKGKICPFDGRVPKNNKKRRNISSVQFSSVQSLSHIRIFATP